MIGIFDSGIGGLCSLYEYKRLCPKESVIYLSDGENAPYGTKSKDEILAITKRNIKTLYSSGATEILIACCTASTVWDSLDVWERGISYPIISPAAKAAACCGKRIAVIATEQTVNSGCFREKILEMRPECTVEQISAQLLVSAVEGGCRDGHLCKTTEAYLDALCDKVRSISPDALILGCTHFSHLEREISRRIGDCRTVNAAKLGAKMLAETVEKKRKKS